MNKPLILLVASLALAGCPALETGPIRPTPPERRLQAPQQAPASPKPQWYSTPVEALASGKPVCVILGPADKLSIANLSPERLRRWVFTEVNLSFTLKDGTSLAKLWEEKVGRPIRPPEVMLYDPETGRAILLNGSGYCKPFPLTTKDLESFLYAHQPEENQ